MTLRLSAIAVVSLLTVAAPRASEVVYFTNGSQMIVNGHAVDSEKNMIRLDLGGGSAVAFPAVMVEKIDASGRNVYLGPTLNPTNRAAAGSGQFSGGSLANGAPGSAASPWAGRQPPGPRFGSASERRRQMMDPEQQMAFSGPEERRDGTPAPGPAGARMRSMARPRDAAPDDPLGATPLPDGRYQINAGGPQTRKTYPSFGPRVTAPTPAPVDPNEQPAVPPAEDSGSGDGSEG